MSLNPPRVLELTKGVTRPVRVTLVSSYEQGFPANTSSATSAVLSISTSVDVAPFYIKNGTISDGVATFSPSQGDADAWPVGQYVAVVTVIYPSGLDKSEYFQTKILQSLAHA